MRTEKFHFRPFTLTDFSAPDFIPAQRKQEDGEEEDALAAGGVSIEEEELPPAPVIDEKALEEARSEGFEDGLQQGIAEGLKQAQDQAAATEEMLSKILHAIALDLNDMQNAYRQFIRGQRSAIAQLVMAIARKLCGEVAKKHPTAAIEGMVAECMEVLYGQPEIRLVVHSSLSQPIKQRLGDILTQTGFTGEVHIVQDDSLGMQDCRVEWQNGCAEHDTDEVWHEIEAIVSRMELGESYDAPAEHETPSRPKVIVSNS